MNLSRDYVCLVYVRGRRNLCVQGDSMRSVTYKHACDVQVQVLGEAPSDLFRDAEREGVEICTPPVRT
eukprot:2526755-Amphidinium_carterae.3